MKHTQVKKELFKKSPEAARGYRALKALQPIHRLQEHQWQYKTDLYDTDEEAMYMEFVCHCGAQKRVEQYNLRDTK